MVEVRLLRDLKQNDNNCKHELLKHQKRKRNKQTLRKEVSQNIFKITSRL